MTERGVIASHFFLFVIASERSKRSNPLIPLDTKGNVQWGDCFTPTHLSTLRFAMTGCCKRLLRRFAPRNDGKKETRNDGKKGTRNDRKKETRNNVKRRTCNEKKKKVFCNQNNFLLQKIFKFFKGLIILSIRQNTFKSIV